MQEQLQWPVIPITIRGACELFPLKAFFNQSGWVRGDLTCPGVDSCVQCVSAGAGGGWGVVGVIVSLLLFGRCLLFVWQAAKSSSLPYHVCRGLARLGVLGDELWWMTVPLSLSHARR